MTSTEIHLHNAAAIALAGIIAGLFSPFVGLGVALITAYSFYAASKVGKSGHRTVLVSGDEYDDIGDTPAYIGLYKWFRDVRYYDPMTRHRGAKDVRVQCKDGSFILVDLSWTWTPNKKNLKVFFSEDWDAVTSARFPLLVQEVGKRLNAAEIVKADFVSGMQEMQELVGGEPGVFFGGPHLTNVRLPDGRDLRDVIRDNTLLIESAVNEIQDEFNLALTRARLKEEYPPEVHDRIDKLIENKAFALRKRGMK